MALAATKPNTTDHLSAGVRGLHVSSSPVQESRSHDAKSLATSTTPQALSILMIGSTGNGKSSLGNFLLDPSDEHILGKNTIFRTGRSNLPETQHVQYKQCAYDQDVSLSLLVIDTPCLNNRDAKDLSHMIDLVETLNRLESITACLFCIKFDTKIDAQYKYTAAYYRKLLPSLFEGNVIIVLTNFPNDRRSVRMRDAQRVDVDAIVRNAQEEIAKSANLAFDPPVFLIDSLPMSEEERRTSLSCRSSIMDYIQQSLQPIWIKELYVAKTQALKECDDKEIKELDGEIHVYNNRLKEVNRRLERILDEIEQAQKEATELRREIQNIEAQLHEKDSDQKVTVKLAEKNAAYTKVAVALDKDRITQEEYQQEIELLNAYIEERNKRKDEISGDLISIEEAYKRLAELST